MHTYRIETTISKNGTISIRDLPFEEGDKVEVLVRSKQDKEKKHEKYPLRGLPIRYVEPFNSVAENDWAILS